MLANMMHRNIQKEVLIIDMLDIPFIDSSACFAIDEVIQRLHEDGKIVLIFGIDTLEIEKLEKTDVLTRLGRENIFTNRLEALEFAKTLLN